MKKELSLSSKYQMQMVVAIAVGTLAFIGLVAIIVSASAGELKLTPLNTIPVSETQDKKPESSASEVIVYASDLNDDALYEFDFWKDAASPGGKMIGTPNSGDELDPPPENDPHVNFKLKVQRGIPYRCWIHMKVGAPKGKSKANKFWVQFSDAVDKANKEVFRPRSGSYLTAQGPEQEGWTWVECVVENAKSSESLIYFRNDGEVTIRLQAGMEGVGFDQFLLSPAKFLEKPPSEAVVKK